METFAEIRTIVDTLYRTEARRVFATLIRKVGEFDLAEEALHEAFRAALEQWPAAGVPANPRAWLVTVGRFKAIDRLRRRGRMDSMEDGNRMLTATDHGAPADEIDSVGDDLLRLIFTCCHPALAPEAQVALTLREMVGLTTEAIAHAFLVPLPTLAQRIVRAKAKIRDAHIPYQVPSSDELPERLEAVLRVIYLIYNEGYFASSGPSLTRADLSGEAIRLGRLLAQMLPEPEVIGLLALMLLQESRRTARTSTTGDLILLEDQDRRLWHRAQIDEGLQLAGQALAGGRIGTYCLQAAIAAEHARAAEAAATDWNQIVRWYDLLLQLTPSPVVALNRAVAVAMRDGPQAGLALIDGLLAGGELTEYHLAHAARGDLSRRLGRNAQARAAYALALALTRQAPERRFLLRRMEELSE